MTHHLSNYRPAVCVEACNVPLLKCQIQYQWGIQTLWHCAENLSRCQNTDWRGCDSKSLSLAEDITVCFSALALDWLLRARLSSLTLNCPKSPKALLPMGAIHRTKYSLDLVCTYYPGRTKPFKHPQCIAATIWLTEFIVHVQHLSAVRWLLCQPERAAQLAT